MSAKPQHADLEIEVDQGDPSDLLGDGSEEGASTAAWEFDPDGDYTDEERDILIAMGHSFDKPAETKVEAKAPKEEKPIIPLDSIKIDESVQPIKGKSVEDVLAAIPEDQRGDVLALIKGLQRSATQANQARAKLAMPAAKAVPADFDALDPASMSAYIEARINEGIRGALSPMAKAQEDAEVAAEFEAFVEANPLMQDDTVVNEVLGLMEKNANLSMEDAYLRVENKRLREEKATAYRTQQARKAAAKTGSGTRATTREEEDVDEDGIPLRYLKDKNFDILGAVVAKGARR
jgi:hypothetical protein